jgi:hypothetical protein
VSVKQNILWMRTRRKSEVRIKEKEDEVLGEMKRGEFIKKMKERRRQRIQSSKEGKLEVSWNSRNSLPTNLPGNSVGRRDITSHITQSVISTGRSKSHDTEAQYYNTRKRKPSDRIQTRINASFCLYFSISPMRRRRENKEIVLCSSYIIILQHRQEPNLF